MGSSLNVFVLLWITVNLARGESVNFNPVLADVEDKGMDKRIVKVREEASAINLKHLNLDLLERFSDQLIQDRSSFIMGTGFQLKSASQNNTLEIAYKDLDKSLKEAETLSLRVAGLPIGSISQDDLRNLETVFTDLEMFYQSQLRFVKNSDTDLKIPRRQKRWFLNTRSMRKNLWQNFTKVMFDPQSLYTDLQYLYQHAPVLLNFLLPEFTALGSLDLTENLYPTPPRNGFHSGRNAKISSLGDTR